MKLWEYYIQQFLSDTFAAIAATPAILDDILDASDTLTIPATQRQNLKDWFSDPTHAGLPIVQQGYSFTPPPEPLICVVLGNMSEGDQLIGESQEVFNIGDSYENPTQEGITREWAAQMQRTYTLMVYANNADLCIWLHLICYYTMLLARKYLEEQGFYQMRLSGSDFQMVSQQQGNPDPVWLRSLSVSGESYDQVFNENPATIIDAVWVTDTKA